LSELCAKGTDNSDILQKRMVCSQIFSVNRTGTKHNIQLSPTPKSHPLSFFYTHIYPITLSTQYNLFSLYPAQNEHRALTPKRLFIRTFITRKVLFFFAPLVIYIYLCPREKSFFAKNQKVF